MDLNTEKIDRMVEAIHHKFSLSGVVLIKQANEVIFESAYGYANRAEKILNTPLTRFGIASGCKLFTAIGICQLVEKGLIHFDTPLKECLAYRFPHFDERVTIHHLLTHSSGIPDYFDEETMDDYAELWKERPMYHVECLKDFLPMFQNNKMTFSPGDNFQYNNAAFILLGLIIEQLTDQTFDTYILENIFEPCGMVDSGYFRMDELPSRTAYGYLENDENILKTNIYSIPVKGGADGGAFVTAPDMAKLWKGLLSGRLLNKNTVQTLLHPHISVQNSTYYGYGIWLNNHRNQLFKYHVMGYDPGVAFRSAVYPEWDLLVVVTANKSDGPHQVVKALEDNFILK